MSFLRCKLLLVYNLFWQKSQTQHDMLLMGFPSNFEIIFLENGVLNATKSYIVSINGKPA